MPRTEPDRSRPIVIDFKRAPRAPLNQFVDRLCLGELTIGGAAFAPNHGSWIATAQLVIGVHRSGPYELEWREGALQKRRVVRPGMVHVTPPGSATYMRWGDACPEIAALAVEQTMVQRIIDDAGLNPNANVPIKLALRDPMIRQLAEACGREVIEFGTTGRLFAESLTMAVVTHIFRTYASGGPPLVARGGLTPKHTRRVLSYIADHLAEDIGVDDLAAEVGLSAHYFAETFKKTVGVTPYRYLLTQRIERAKNLLRDGKTPLAKIAEMVGFSSQTQFTAHFRNMVGITPARFRRDA